MKFFRHAIVLIGLSLAGIFLQAQTNHKITTSKLELDKHHNQYGQGRIGLKLTFDIEFNWLEADFFQRTFDVEYRIQQGDKVLAGSRGSIRKASNISPTPAADSKSMKESHYSLFIPFHEIPLESGQQEIEIFFSLYNKNGQYPDCFSFKINYLHEKIEQYDLNQQEFSFSPMQVEQYYRSHSSYRPTMRLSSKITTKYPPKNCKVASYNLVFKLLDANKKLVYDSEKAPSTFSSPKINISPVEVAGKGEASFAANVDYNALDAEGPTKLTMQVFLLEAEGGPKLIYSEDLDLTLPTKYNFSEQSFTISGLEASDARKDGVGGIEIQFHALAKHSSFLRDHEKGAFYFFPLIYDANGKLVIKPELSTQKGGGTTKLMHGFLPEPDVEGSEGSLFIPYYLLDLAPGPQSLKVVLQVSDINLGTKFPELAEAKPIILQPKTVQWRVNVEEITMVDGNYDADFLGLSARLPELQYTLCVGRDRFYESNYTKNSLSAQSGSATLRISEGDEIYLVLYDVDSGFFNNDDSLGKWLIAYSKGSKSLELKLDNQGQVKKMRITGNQL